MVILLLSADTSNLIPMDGSLVQPNEYLPELDNGWRTVIVIDSRNYVKIACMNGSNTFSVSCFGVFLCL